MIEITAIRPDYPILFGGFGFHNSEALFYRLIEKEHFDQKICKCYRELSPGFMRTFAGYPDWTRESMDTFADYYERMQKVTDTPIYFAAAKGQLHFNDDERRKYAENVAERLDYLVMTRGVKQLRYYCFSNEMSIMDWGGLLRDLPLFKKYHEYLYEAFQNRGLNIGLLATDASSVSNWNTLDWAAANMKQITEDFCLHAYINDYRWDDLDKYNWFYNLCRDAVMKSINCDGKRFILGELGVSNTANLLRLPGVIRDVNMLSDSDEAPFGALYTAELILAAINAGCFAVVIWTFSDYPDPYVCHYAEHDEYAKKWGECEHFISHTQDVKYNKWGMIKWEDDGDYSVRPNYYCLGLISRFCRRNSKLLEFDCDDPLLRICGHLNRDGSLSILIINRHTEPTDIKLDLKLKHLDSMKPFHVYEFDPRNVPMNEFGDLQDAVDSVDVVDGCLRAELKAETLTVFSTDYEERTDIPASNIVRDGDLLHWDAVNDKSHCYYRVYRGEHEDFVPSRQNQIASTVAETLDFSARYLDNASIRHIGGDYYKVLSIGKKR